MNIFLLISWLHIVPPFLWFFETLWDQHPHHLHIIQFYIIFLNALYFSLSMHIYFSLGSNLCECHIHSYFVHLMRELLVISIFSTGEFCTIFISAKFHFDMLKPFYYIWSSWYCNCVYTLLNLYFDLFYYCCLFIIHMFLLAVYVILVTSYIIVLFCLFNIVDCNVGLAMNVLSSPDIIVYLTVLVLWVLICSSSSSYYPSS